MGSPIWKILYRRWQKDHAPPTPGYTVLLPVPGDLPFFLELALRVCMKQDTKHLSEILVVPDVPSPVFRQTFSRCRQEYHDIPLRLVRLAPLDRMLVRAAKNPHHNHWIQMVAGVREAATSHVLLHDADCFAGDHDFFRRLYQKAVDTGAACVGITEVWDEWYREVGLDHVTATWELMFRRDWARSFSPYMHRGQKTVFNSRTHDFDTMLLPQCLTPPNKILRYGGHCNFVHFNYVICTYRWFAASPSPFEDEYFRLLLIRLLSGDEDAWTNLPQMEEFHLALHARSKVITYGAPATRANYPEFRSKLETLLELGIVDSSRTKSIRGDLQPFDSALL